jgi:hypothetical protein
MTMKHSAQETAAPAAELRSEPIGMSLPAAERPSLDSLMCIVGQEAKKRRRAQKITNWSNYGFLLIVSLIFAAYAIDSFATGRWVHFPTYLFNLFSLFGVFGAAAAVSKALRDATGHLVAFNDPRVAGPLAEGLWLGDRDFALVCSRRLIEVLPLLRPEHAAYQSEEQKQSIVRILKGPFPLETENEKLVISTLKAMEQIGDATAMPLIQRLCTLPKDEYPRFEARLERIRSAARECLPFVEQRIEADRARQTLLRPAEAGSDELLRPAGSAVSNPEELLRPSDRS